MVYLNNSHCALEELLNMKIKLNFAEATLFNARMIGFIQNNWPKIADIW